MRKLKLQVQMTIDGFISGANGAMDWMLLPWSDDLIAFVADLTEPVDTILLGKNLAQGFIPHWKAALDQPNPEPGAQKFVETHKIVFSKTITVSEWENTVIENGDFVAAIHALKQQDGGDMIAYGGGQFVSSLIKEQLIDELHFFINPAIIGTGMSIFQAVTETQNYKAISAKHFDCGIIVLTYMPVRHA